VFIAMFSFAVPQAAAQGPLTPTNILQNPAALSLFPDDFAAESVPTPYTDLVMGPTSFAATGNYLGAKVISSVYEDPSTGYLAFAYQFENTSTATNDLARATINDSTDPWAGFTFFDAGADGAGASHSAGSATGTWTNGNPYYIQQDSSDSGIVLQFDVGDLGTVMLSQDSDTSATIWLATNAKNFGLTDVGLSDSTAVGTSMAYGPAAGTLTEAVPEPSTIVTFLIGLSILAATWRRRSVGSSLARNLPAKACARN